MSDRSEFESFLHCLGFEHRDGWANPMNRLVEDLGLDSLDLLELLLAVDDADSERLHEDAVLQVRTVGDIAALWERGRSTF